MISSAELLLAFAVAAPSPHLVDTLPPERVVAAVREAFAARSGVEVDRLVLDWGRLPAWSPDTGAIEVRLGPAGNEGWAVATLRGESGRPVAVRVRAGMLTTLPVTTRAITRGELLEAGDVTLGEAIAWLGDVDAPLDQSPVGWEMRQSVAGNQPVTRAMLQPPKLISAGDEVAFVWQRGGVRLERVATAIAAARLGEPVRARAGDVQLVGRVAGPGLALMEGGTR